MPAVQRLMTRDAGEGNGDGDANGERDGERNKNRPVPAVQVYDIRANVMRL